MTLSCKCVFCEPEYNTRWKCKNEMYQPIVICIVFMVTPGVMVIKISKLAHFFCISCWIQQKIGHSLGKMFKYILKILFRFFRKCYGLLRSELSLAWFQPLKIQGFGIFLLTQLGFFIHPLCKLYPLVHFIFVSQDHQNSFLCPPPPPHFPLSIMFLSVKYTFTWQRWQFSTC